MCGVMLTGIVLVAQSNYVLWTWFVNGVEVGRKHCCTGQTCGQYEKDYGTDSCNSLKIDCCDPITP